MFEDTNMKAVSAEVMGTFFLVFIGITAYGTLGGGFGGAFAFGATLMVLMHVMGPISGCHLNPAVTIGNFMSNKMSQDDTAAYVLAQIAGAFIAFAAITEAPFGMDANIAFLGRHGILRDCPALDSGTLGRRRSVVRCDCHGERLR